MEFHISYKWLKSMLKLINFRFARVFLDKDNEANIYQEIMDPMLNHLINGFNASLLMFGEVGSGKSYTLAGHESQQSGLYFLSIFELFRKLEIDARFRSCYKVLFSIFEIHKDLAVDLLKVGNPQSITKLNLECSEEHGYVLQNVTEIEINSAAQGNIIFKECWDKRVTYDKSHVEFQSAVFIRLRVYLKNMEQDHQDTVSCLNLVYMPPDESLLSHSDISKHIELLSQGNLAHQADIQSNSFLCQLLRNELQGNCVTRALLCLPPQPDTAILTHQLGLFNCLSKLTTAPIVNTNAARILYSRLIRQTFDFLGNIDTKFNTNSPLYQLTKSLKKENSALQDRLDDVLSRLEEASRNYNHVHLTRTRISDQLLVTEQDQVKAARQLIDIGVENARLKDQMGRSAAQYSTEVVHLKQKVDMLEVERDAFKKDSQMLKKLSQEHAQLGAEHAELRQHMEKTQNDKEMLSTKCKELQRGFLNIHSTKGQSPIAEMFPDHIKKDEKMKFKIGRLQEQMRGLKKENENLRTLQVKHQSELKLMTQERDQFFKGLSEVSTDMMKNIGQIRQKIQHHLDKMGTLLDNTNHLHTNQLTNYRSQLMKMLYLYDSTYKQRHQQIEELFNNLRTQYDKIRNANIQLNIDNKKLQNQLQTQASRPIHARAYSSDQADLLRDSSSALVSDRGNQHSNDRTSNASMEIERAQLLSDNAHLNHELSTAQQFIQHHLHKHLIG